MKKKDLVVVESPAKAKTINRILGKKYTVKSSKGHIKDLPKSNMGIEIENNFKPEYVLLEDKKEIVEDIKRASANADTVFLATDPDREGEAISYHLSEEIRGINSHIKRILLHEITKRGIEEAFKNAGQIDMNKVNAQVARRVLDRLVGYMLSPLLWKKVKRGLSAGRVQSVALRLIVDREKEIRNFIKKEYWTITAEFEKDKKKFQAKLEEKDEKKFEINNKSEAESIVRELKDTKYIVSEIKKKRKKKQPPPPFITSTLQQEAYRRFKFPVKKTMQIAQKLYEGVNINGVPIGLITYMRTDSLRISQTAQNELRKFIVENYGENFLSKKTRNYRNKNKAQDAHEAIRPTSILRTPDSIKEHLTPDEQKIYKLIWDRFLLTQLKEAIIEETEVKINAKNYTFKAKGEVIVDEGFLKFTGKEKKSIIPELTQGEELELLSLTSKQNFTQPPSRYTEGSLVKTLEEKGIGRPSTYATIISTLKNRLYVKVLKGVFYPTELGMFISELLVENFGELMDIKFTANMEEELDRVSSGKTEWVKVVSSFFLKFKKDIDEAYRKIEYFVNKGIPTDKVCVKCGSMMFLRDGKYGKYYSCSNSECGHSEKYQDPLSLTDEKCPVCGAPLVWRKGKYGRFIACSNYPKCNYIKKKPSQKTEYPCPKGDGGVLVRRKGKRGYFYGCSLYPKCNFIITGKIIENKCPECGLPYMVSSKRKIKCPKCGYEENEKK